MALLYPWATKEYLLWSMTIGQLIMYHNAGIELKYPSQEAGAKGKGYGDMSAEERKTARDAARAAMKAERAAEDEAASDAAKEQYRQKYGAI